MSWTTPDTWDAYASTPVSVARMNAQIYGNMVVLKAGLTDDGLGFVGTTINVGLSSATKVSPGGIADANIGTFQVRHHTTSGSAFITAGYIYEELTVASSNSVQGFVSQVITNHSTGTAALAIALSGNACNYNNATTTELRGVQGGVQLDTGSGGGTNAACFYAVPTGRVHSGTGTFTNGYGLYVSAFGSGFTNKYAIYVSDATAISFFNGPIKFGTGQLIGAGVGGSLATLNPNGIGGVNQPSGAVQFGWAKFLDDAGNPCYVPLWA